ncbi:MAG: sensor histidine kinase, partial [bacterium]
THVIEHTRLFARGAEDSELVPVQVNEVIGSALGLIGAQLRARGLVVQCELGAGLPAVLANPFSLEEVILNLLNNARDALMEKEGEGTPDNTPRVMIRTGETGKDSLRFVSIDVIDQGTGIPREVLGKVFDPFFTTKSPDRGTGLGLAVSKSIVEGFKGSIAIRSKPGKGTTVSVYLPAIQENKEQDNG